MVSVVLFGLSLPLIQCTGASKCVPECSPSLSQFHAQNGPSLSYLEIGWISIAGVFLPICGGSLISGVSGPSGAVRSTTSTAPDNSALASSLRTWVLDWVLDMASLLRSRALSGIE